MGRWCSRITLVNSSVMFCMSFSCAFSFPKSEGISLLRCMMMRRWMRIARTLLTNSLILRSHERAGMSSRSFMRSPCSCWKRNSPSLFFSKFMGLSLNEPMYTRHTSGVLNTLPSDHMSAPYTRMSCCASTWSALLSTTRTLSSCPLSVPMTSLNSSEMSSLYGSKRSRMTSQRDANHLHTLMKSYLPGARRGQGAGRRAHGARRRVVEGNRGIQL
mmetsp:Transcript_37765/g.119165  ORF Transcript_37765/g.119165 Transcript_37765/m.119165 type:complete len:216 (+) Transcript_37765:454-1101(+)